MFFGHFWGNPLFWYTLLHEPTIHYECDICSKVFLRPEYLKKHMKVTHWEKQEERCNICNVCIKGRHNVKRHMKEVHNSGMSENCTFCDQRFSRKKRLERALCLISQSKLIFCFINILVKRNISFFSLPTLGRLKISSLYSANSKISCKY